MNRRSFNQALASLIAAPLAAMGLVRRDTAPADTDVVRMRWGLEHGEVSGVVEFVDGEAVTGSHGPFLWRADRQPAIGENTDGILFELRAADPDFPWNQVSAGPE